MQENALLSVIVPCYNEADNLPLFYQHILPVCRSLCEQGSISDYEILLVNDGSKDRTLPTMRALSEQDPHVFFLSFTRNFGKEAAMLAGLLTRGWLSSNLLSALAASALSYLVTGLLHAGALAVTGHGAFVTAMTVTGKEFLITLPALPFLYLLLRFLHEKTHL